MQFMDDFLNKGLMLKTNLLNQRLFVVKINELLRKFYSRHHDFVFFYACFAVCYDFLTPTCYVGGSWFIYIYYLHLCTFTDLQHDFHITWSSCLYTVPRRVPLVDQKQLPSRGTYIHLLVLAVCFAQSLLCRHLWIVVCVYVFYLLSFERCIACPSSFERCIACPSSFERCIACPSSIFSFSFPLWYFQTFLSVSYNCFDNK